MNFQMFKVDLEKADGPEIKLPTSVGSSKKQENWKKKIYLCFIDYTEASDCVEHNKLWKILQEMGIPDQLTCLLRNLYAGQEATVRTGHGTMDWFQVGKGVSQGFRVVNEAETDVFLELLISPWSNESWQFDLWFLCLFETQLVHLEVLGSHTTEA